MSLRPVLQRTTRLLRPTITPKRLPTRLYSTPAVSSSSPSPPTPSISGYKWGTIALFGLLGCSVLAVRIAERSGEGKREELLMESSKSQSPPSPLTPPSSSSPPLDVASVPTSTNPEEVDNSQAAAYNPETGEINWDCPCLGGMADGPCGEDFKLAFSCFVYSEEEPKGVDCVERFRGMQECFRKYPEIYGSDGDEEMEDDVESLAEKALAMEDSEFVAEGTAVAA